MTGLPKKKRSRMRRTRRQKTRDGLFPNLVICSNCGKLKTPHRLCPSCGYYKKRLIIEPKETTKVHKVKEK